MTNAEYRLTLRDRIEMWWKYEVRYQLPHNIAWWIAFHLPRKVALLTLVRVASGASSGKYGNTNPDQLTYSVMYTRFDEGAGR